MASFKEIRKRINSIKSTRKTTSAMKMVSSAKLHKAENRIACMLPYAEALHQIMEASLMDDPDALSRERPVGNVAIIAFASDSSLCGAFNSNVARELQQVVGTYRQSPAQVTTFVYTIGRKVYEAIGKTDITLSGHFENLTGKSDYPVIADFAESLIRQFEKQEIDRVELIYHHFKSAGSQLLVREQLLPVRLHQATKARHTDYIFEPSQRGLLKTLIPQSIKLQLYTALLDSNASEHAARMVAMQTATDNADELINELTIEYNKSRQQAITNELLDIAGGHG
ncbi:MAG: ATP synthase F1 subunit gamma [Tannerellaceae bacterium]|jgi:F-type H+-transporting ATPase subunit gamma|nr:ATP synthase F1 subunit gamma [Tannerellaceae bacterium]